MTIATDLGFVVGKLYRLKEDDMEYSRFMEGSIVRFERDDATDIPYFRRISDEDSGYVPLARLETTCGNPVQPEKPVVVVEPVAARDEVTYTVEVNSDNSNIFVRKQLSYDQIKRIIDIVGE